MAEQRGSTMSNALRHECEEELIAMKRDQLTVILEFKQQEVKESLARVPESILREQAERRVERPRFLEVLSAPGPLGANIIAEIKRGSPSKGVIREDLNAVEYSQAYERGGAAAISVLTDRRFFYGSPEDLSAVRASVQLPVLRKDFVVSHYQIYEAVCWGADAVLLIVRALEPESLRAFLELCGELRLDALVEVHSLPELEIAASAGARLIGINNRDLTTFKTDLQTSIDLVKRLDVGQIAVAESGIHTRDDLMRLFDAGIWNFLIGESIVRADHPEQFLGSLLGR
jgi:indole-3-glycerol phosphate synthase